MRGAARAESGLAKREAALASVALRRSASGVPFSAIRSPKFCDRRTGVSIKLHRCSNEWLKIAPHPCWKVQKALDDQGIDYELVKGPVRRGKRDELERLSGQSIYPVIEFEDGRIYRAESEEMAARIGSGQLLSEAAPVAPPASA